MYIQELLTEICKRGCSIGIKGNYCIDYLPECLVSYDDCSLNYNGDANTVYLMLDDDRYYCDDDEDYDNDDDNKNFEFIIKSIKPTSVYVGITKTTRKREITYNAHYLSRLYPCIMSIKNNFIEINRAELDRITHYLYMDGDVSTKWNTIAYFGSEQITSEIMDLYREQLIGKLIASLMKYKNIIYKFMLPLEIKQIIMQNIKCLDKWDNLNIKC